MDFLANVNTQVKVKLTEDGVNILKRKRKELNEMITARGGKGLGDFELRTDCEGYSEFQMWDLMNIFGESMSLAHAIPFDTEIIIYRGTPVDHFNMFLVFEEVSDQYGTSKFKRAFLHKKNAEEYQSILSRRSYIEEIVMN